MLKRLYPLKFKPIYKEKIWGGQMIRTTLGMDFSPLVNCGEAWVLSGYENDPSVVSNGFLADNELSELIEVYMDDLIGERAFEKFGDRFPLLVKIINSSDYLSIQVHPDDELAFLRHQSNGKSEMWYVIDAEKDAELISGFNKKVDRQQYIQHLQNKTIKDILNVEKVRAGDVFYVPAGRIHALGPGILLTEIQQTSDLTYRIYDWDRVDDQGKSRELHTVQAMEAIDFELHDQYRTRYDREENQPVPLVESPYFTTNLLELTKTVSRDYSGRDTFVIYICVRGKAELVYHDGRLTVSSGDAVLIPAEIPECRLIPSPFADLLEVYLEE